METDILLMDELSITSSDPPRRRKMGTNGRKVFSHHSVDESSDEELLDIGKPAGARYDEKIQGNIM
jgi:hypothetical protein